MSDGTATLIILLAVGLLICAARIQASGHQADADRCREAEDLRSAIKRRRARASESDADFKQQAATQDLTAAIDCNKD